jgi:primosomal replication protein N
VTTSINLSGRIARVPDLRTTPAGTSVLRLLVDCGENGTPMLMNVRVVGAHADRLAPHVRVGTAVRAVGELRLAHGNRNLNVMEVIADELVVADKAV